MPDPFRYDVWSALLADIVTPEGKVDYARLAEHRGLLERVVAELGAASPESDPGRFPSEEDRLAYWLNAYNAFTLHAIIAEYPITSVWKTRDGQFFQRRRHVAGGRAVSLDDIEHEILRGQFAEPRIHFAINCGSNGCPPMRPAAYEGARLRETLRAAAEQFLSGEWNLRIDHAARRIFISRIFKMYAGDFAGEAGTTEEYRRGVLRFVARHTGVAFERIADYEVVYNVYDWGLNDAARTPHLGPILFHEPVEHFAEGDTDLRELHLYEGNFCNRTCAWCTINGSPQGWYERYSPAVLDQALATLAPDGNLKFYGGEPTLHAEEIERAIRYVRERGFRGLVTIFSNGVKAERLIDILESDARSEAVLNYSIYHGRDRLGRRPALRPRPRGRLPRPRHRLRALLPGADHEGPFPRLPVRRRDRCAALRPRARRDRPAGRVPELPHVPSLGGRRARSRRARAWCDQLPDVPPVPGGAAGAGVRAVPRVAPAAPLT